MEQPVKNSSQTLRTAESCSPGVTRIYVDGVFDLFHWGHVELFRSARGLAANPYLIVGVCADEDVDYKQRPTLTLDERIRVVDACELVDEVIRGPVPVSCAFLESMDIGLVVHGDDTSAENRKKWYSSAIELGIYREVPYTREINSVSIRKRILNV
jgi:cytidyltransferase-like protein